MLKPLIVLICVGCTAACLSPRAGGPQQLQPAACGVQRWWKLIPDLQPAAGSRPDLVRKAEVEEARGIIDLMVAAATGYCKRFGEYPRSVDRMVRYSRTLDRRAGCAVPHNLPADPWGTPYRYERVNGAPSPRSAGPDRRFGTGDDVVLPSAGDAESERFDPRALCGEPRLQP